MLSSTNASASNNLWNNISPTNSVFSIRSGGSAQFWDGKNQIAYCFAPVEGYSAFGSYAGNGSTDGTFVYTGFRPRWLLIKNAEDAGNYWWIIDSKRSSYNNDYAALFANVSNAENNTSAVGVDILSNGFKSRTSDGGVNPGTGSTVIYAAFAENPFSLARAR